MTTVTVTITGWDKIVAKYGKEATDKALRKGLQTGTDHGADLVKKRVGQHVVTGFMRSSIKGNVKSSKEGKMYAAAGGGVYYTRFVEEGTGVYGKSGKPIVPKRAKALAWHPKTVTGAPKKGAGKIVRRSVKGQKPVRMFADTFKYDRPKMIDAFVRGFRSSYLGG